MSDNAKKPGVAFWATIALVVVLAYPLSLGPACWLSSRADVGAGFVSRAYRPLTWTVEATKSTALMNGIGWYAKLAAADGYEWAFNPDEPGNAEWFALLKFNWTSRF